MVTGTELIRLRSFLSHEITRFTQKSITTMIWRPRLVESSDGLPLATQLSDFYSTFQYERLTTENQIVALTTRPEMVALLVGFYLVSKPIFQGIAKVINPKSFVFKSFVAVHNLALAIFSGVVAYNIWPIVVSHYLEEGFMASYCDQDGSFWQSGLGAWSVIFYVSKYYEFLDTWILVLKRKSASFLQVYHHTGVVLTMWAGVLSQSVWLQVVVMLNSVIHTFMYVYFFIKTVSPTTEIKAARYLTMAQILQFITGITVTLGVLWMGDDCDTISSRAALVALHVYGYGLIALFVAFANRKYKKS